MLNATKPEVERLTTLATRFLEAWNTQDVGIVLSCYTPDLEYRDPNTRGVVLGADAMSRYLDKLFASWQMHWELRDLYSVADGDLDGAAVRWRATLRRQGAAAEVAVEGMDLVLLRGDLIAVNEVQFDRAALVPLLS